MSSSEVVSGKPLMYTEFSATGGTRRPRLSPPSSPFSPPKSPPSPPPPSPFPPPRRPLLRERPPPPLASPSSPLRSRGARTRATDVRSSSSSFEVKNFGGIRRCWGRERSGGRLTSGKESIATDERTSCLLSRSRYLKHGDGVRKRMEKNDGVKQRTGWTSFLAACTGTRSNRATRTNHSRLQR